MVCFRQTIIDHHDAVDKFYFVYFQQHEQKLIAAAASFHNVSNVEKLEDMQQYCFLLSLCSRLPAMSAGHFSKMLQFIPEHS
jgi:hypothetical protein